jgi:hypothetical protein
MLHTLCDRDRLLAILDLRDAAEGAENEVHVRTCQQAGCSDDPAWSAAVAPSAAIAVAPGRYLQVRVDMISNGLVEPELRGLAVMYRRDG